MAPRHHYASFISICHFLYRKYWNRSRRMILNRGKDCNPLVSEHQHRVFTKLVVYEYCKNGTFRAWCRFNMDAMLKCAPKCGAYLIGITYHMAISQNLQLACSLGCIVKLNHLSLIVNTHILISQVFQVYLWQCGPL